MSITTAKASQAAAKAKAQRLCGMSNTAKPFYTDNKEVGEKTGMRPVSKQGLKAGGKVIGGKITGPKAKARADRPGRKSGGRVANEIANTDLKAANKSRKGGSEEEKGALKRGGKIKKAMGGPSGRLAEQVGKDPVNEQKNMQQYEADNMLNSGGVQALYAGAMRKNGGKVGKKSESKDAKSDKAWDKYKSDAKKNGISDDDAEESKGKFKPADAKAKPSKMSEKIDDVEPDDDEDNEGEEKLKKGGRVGKFGGGAMSFGSKMMGKKKVASKGKKGGGNNTTIIFAGTPGGAQAGAPPAAPPLAPGPRAPAPVLPPMDGGPNPPPGAGDQPMPPMGAMAPNPQMPPPPPGAMGPGGPGPIPRKAGGRVNYASMKAGSGSGLGRLKKAGISGLSK